MKNVIKYIALFIVLMVFQPGMIYLVLSLVLNEYNPLNWHPVIYTVFFELVIFFGYISHRAITDKDEFVDMENMFYDKINNNN